MRFLKNIILYILGDAMLCLWEVSSFLRMKATVAHVLNCAMGIQERMGEWMTSVGVKLKVKIGIRCFPFIFIKKQLFVE